MNAGARRFLPKPVVAAVALIAGLAIGLLLLHVARCNSDRDECLLCRLYSTLGPIAVAIGLPPVLKIFLRLKPSSCFPPRRLAVTFGDIRAPPRHLLFA